MLSHTMIIKSMVLLVISSLANIAIATSLPLAIDEVPVPSLAPMLEKVQASLVTVSSEATVQVRRDPFDDPFFRRFFDQRRSSVRKREMQSVGVIIDAEQGYVLTNEHAIRGASSIDVKLESGRVFEGVLVGIDPNYDLALIKIDPADLTAIEIGDSSSLRIGDFVVSIGDPFGEQNTIVSGIVSSPARPNSLKQYQHFIHSDAAVGSGVLVNLKGQLIGLNIAQSSSTAANAKIGFSTPVNMAMRVSSQLAKFGTPQRGFVSVRVQDLTQQLALAFDLDQVGGVVVTKVSAGSKAAESGIEVGDVVLTAGGQPIRNRKELTTIVNQQFAGDILSLTVLRQGQEIAIETVLESSSIVSKVGTLIHRQLEGATLNELGDGQQDLGLRNGGVIVSKVIKGSVAWDHGVRENDVITSVNRTPVKDLASFREAIKDQDVLMLNIVRGSGAMYVLLQ
ncbi:MAG: PDZ domain-containing protein [Gammaproteobacteria bacterium]|nr:PDZ domain-containing protein [Gammaproteobacteria bacterium]